MTDPAPAPAKLRLRDELLRGNRATVTIAFVLGLVAALATVALPLVVRELIQAIQADDGSLTTPILLMAALALGGGVASALSAFMLARVGENMVLDLRSRVIGRVLRMPLRVVRREGHGTVVARVTSDAAQLRAVVDVGVTQLPTSGLSVILGLVIMGLLDWVLLLIALGSFAVSAAAITVVVRGVRRSTLAQQTAIGQLAQDFSAALGALPIIKAQRAEARVADAVSASARDAAGAAVSAARLQSFVSPVMELGLQAALIGVVVGSGARLASGALSVPDFAAFLLYLLQLVSPLTVVALGVSRLQTGLSARSRVEQILAVPQESDAGDAAAPAAASAHALQFDDVSFAYDREPVLRHVTFSAPARGLTAIVGPSGAGKSTLLSLIERFVEPASGRIRVLGHDIERWPLSGLRRRLGYVDQAFTLIEDTIRANLVLGRETPASDAELLQTLDLVGLRADVLALPDGLDTEIGRATDLSGGQRQRLAFARALLTEADIILLDEPTAQLDTVNDELLRVVIERLAHRRAVVVVAHRIATIQSADRIVVLEAGAVVDHGTHEELVQRCATYAALVHGQRLSETGRIVDAPVVTAR